MNIFRFCSLAFLALCLAACASMVQSRSVQFSSAELQAALAKNLDSVAARASRFKIKVSEPSLSMLAAEQRLLLGFAVSSDAQELTSRLGRAAALNAVVSMSTGLRFDAGDQSLRLVAPKFLKIDANLTSSSLANALIEPILKELLERELAGAAVYRFKPEQLNRGSKQWTISALKVTETGLQVDLQAIQ
jgi:hypothetical protein